jgi:predicted outer membrane repeat protein
VFDSNVAETGDGGALNFLEAGFVRFNNTLFINNIAATSGGALSYNGDLATLSIENTTFVNNRAQGGCGGGLGMVGGRSVQIVGGAFRGNTAAGDGGAVRLSRSDREDARRASLGRL